MVGVADFLWEECNEEENIYFVFGNIDVQEIKRPRVFSVEEYAADGGVRTKYEAPSFELDPEMNL